MTDPAARRGRNLTSWMQQLGPGASTRPPIRGERLAREAVPTETRDPGRELLRVAATLPRRSTVQAPHGVRRGILANLTTRWRQIRPSQEVEMERRDGISHVEKAVVVGIRCSHRGCLECWSPVIGFASQRGINLGPRRRRDKLWSQRVGLARRSVFLDCRPLAPPGSLPHHHRESRSP